MATDLPSKLKQVIEQIPKDVLYDFVCSYAQSHEDLAMALVSEFWQAEKGDYHSMVQQCLMHPTPSRVTLVDNISGGFDRLYSLQHEVDELWEKASAFISSDVET